MADRPLALLQQRYAQQRAATVARTTTAWDSLDSIDSDVVDDLIERALVPIVRGGQQAVAANTLAYLELRTGAELAVDVAEVLDALRNGVPPAEVYRRPAIRTWQALAEGVPYVDAVARGRARLEALTLTDLATAQTNVAQRALADVPTVRGYRRVLGPGFACSLCVIAARPLYRRGDLMPLHERCDCTIEPVLFRDEAGAGRARRLSADSIDEVTIDERGDGETMRVEQDTEIGPMLVTRPVPF